MTNQQLQEAAKAKYPYPEVSKNSTRQQMKACDMVDREREAFLDGAAYMQVQSEVEPDFIEFIKNQRQAFSEQVSVDGWWYEMGAEKRVIIEDLLIAYDQMVQRLHEFPTPGWESEAVEFKDWCDTNQWGIDHYEEKTHTTAELYFLYKQSLI